MIFSPLYTSCTNPSIRQSLQLLSQLIVNSGNSTFHYNTILRAISLSDYPHQAIRVLNHMHCNSIPLDSYTFNYLFKSCGKASLVPEAKIAHGLFYKLFSNANAWIANPLLQMYIKLNFFDEARVVFNSISMKNVSLWTTFICGLAKGGILNEAHKLFDECPEKNIIVWTSLISGYSKSGSHDKSVDLFKKMLNSGIVPDAAALVSVLSACIQLKELEFGKWIHQLVDKERICMNENLICALIDMYVKCGDIESANHIFKHAGSKVLPACNALIDGYCKLGNLNAAQSIFDSMEKHDIITFNSMISGYIHSSRLNEALFLYLKLRVSGFHPDKFTIVGLLTLCASSGSLSQGKSLHAYLEISSIKPDVFLGTALIEMYAKCGRMDQAILVFRRMSQKDMLSWTSIITGFAMNGTGKLALEYFSLMLRENIKPNSVVYIGVLNACSHSGLVEDGKRYFEEMKSLHDIEPEIEHYGCMVDLFGRCGQLEKAEKIIENMPMKPNAVIWGSLLNSCRVHKNIDLAERVAKQVMELEPDLDAGYVQLFNIYMDFGRKKEALKIRKMMEMKGIRKTSGFSSITILGKVYKFVAGTRLHRESAEIEQMMLEIVKRLKENGYSPKVKNIAVEMDIEEKEQALFGHSERMAIAYGIMKLDSNLPIHIVKNLRVCDDCHDVIKLVSKIWSRDIVVRDRSRFHHFRHGDCSCNDFW